MLIITTIYCTEIEPAEPLPTEKGDAELFDDLQDANREWISIYEGKNRVTPID